MTFKIYPGVKIGKNAQIGDFVIIGHPFPGSENSDIETVIGENCVIRSHSVIYAGNIIGDNFSTGHFVQVRELNKIGDNVSIGSQSVVEHRTEIRSGARIHTSAFIPEYSLLEENSWIGPHAVLTNALYPKSIGVKKNLRGPKIAKNAIVGANATILPGINVGENALIGAGAVIVKEVASKSVAVGNPGKVINTTGNLPYQNTDEHA